jgi:hypothetical protein
MAADILAGLSVMCRRLSIFLLLLPSVASACAVCSDGEKQNAMAFFWTTILLTALPLGLLGGLIRWVQVRSKTLEAERLEREAGSN